MTNGITRAAAKIALGLQDKIYLGNLNAQRDWGHAKDYVRMMWMILQADKPEDWVIATGITTKVRDFVKMAFHEVGIELEFKGEGKEEKGYLSGIDEKIFSEKVGEQYLDSIKQKLSRAGLSPAGGGGTRSVPGVDSSLVPPLQAIIEVDPRYFRPTEDITGKNSEQEILAILNKYGIRVIRDNSHNSCSVEIWGSGQPMREFLWSEEMTDACVYLMKRINFEDVISTSSLRGGTTKQSHRCYQTPQPWLAS